MALDGHAADLQGFRCLEMRPKDHAGVAQPLGVGSVVVAITYLSLIVGELVPKQIALRAPEQVAARVAPMMRIIAGSPRSFLTTIGVTAPSSAAVST